MPTTPTVKAAIQISDGEPKFQLVEKTTKLPIYFTHANSATKAREEALRNQLLNLAKEAQVRAIKLSGDIRRTEHAISIDWNGNLKWELSIRHVEEPDETETRNYRTDCRHMVPDLSTMDIVCTVDPDNPHEVDPKTCNRCQEYVSRYIQYPVTIAGIDTRPCRIHYMRPPGMPVAIRPCDDEKTYLGIYIGDIPMFVSASHNVKTHNLSISPVTNPAFYVFDLEKVIFGAESWWKAVEDPGDIPEISDEIIQRQPYVKLLKELQDHDKPKERT